VKTMLNELSSTVVFERPQEEAFVRKWQLACEGDIAHVVVMPNINVAKLERFVQDLIESRCGCGVAGVRGGGRVGACVRVCVCVCFWGGGGGGPPVWCRCWGCD
jgi:hypothetical protein